jgi:hypothetical protein
LKDYDFDLDTPAMNVFALLAFYFFYHAIAFLVMRKNAKPKPLEIK